MKKSGHRDLDAMTRNLEQVLQEIKQSLEERVCCYKIMFFLKQGLVTFVIKTKAIDA